MKRSEMQLLISDNLFRGYNKDNISLKCLCDNLSVRILKLIEDEGMLPPANESNYHYMDNEARECLNIAKFIHTWENE